MHAAAHAHTRCACPVCHAGAPCAKCGSRSPGGSRALVLAPTTPLTCMRCGKSTQRSLSVSAWDSVVLCTPVCPFPALTGFQPTANLDRLAAGVWWPPLQHAQHDSLRVHLRGV